MEPRTQGLRYKHPPVEARRPLDPTSCSLSSGSPASARAASIFLEMKNRQHKVEFHKQL